MKLTQSLACATMLAVSPMAVSAPSFAGGPAAVGAPSLSNPVGQVRGGGNTGGNFAPGGGNNGGGGAGGGGAGGGAGGGGAGGGGAGGGGGQGNIQGASGSNWSITFNVNLVERGFQNTVPGSISRQCYRDGKIFYVADGTPTVVGTCGGDGFTAPVSGGQGPYSAITSACAPNLAEAYTSIAAGVIQVGRWLFDDRFLTSSSGTHASGSGTPTGDKAFLDDFCTKKLTNLRLADKIGTQNVNR